MALEEWEAAEPGVQRRILPPGKALMMMIVHFEKGARGYEHAHPHEQMTYCLKGRFEFTINGAKHEITEGQNLAIPSNAVHSAIAREEGMLLDSFTPIREDLLTLK